MSRATNNSVSALDDANTLPVMGRKAGTGLTAEQAAHLAMRLKPFHERFDENGAAMARSWGVSQSQLAQILNGRGRGAGVAVLCRLRLHTGISIDDLLGLPRLGPSLEDKIRATVTEELDALGVKPAKRPSRRPAKHEKEA